MRGATLFLVALLASSLTATGQHLPYEMVVNADHHGLAHQGTFDLHPNGPITYVWNTYRANHERVYSTRFENGRRAHAQELGVTKGSAIEISVEDDALVVRKSRYDLHALLARVTPDNLHDESDAGGAMGREEW